MEGIKDSSWGTNKNKEVNGTSLVVRWLRLGAPNAGALGLIPAPGTRFPHLMSFHI